MDRAASSLVLRRSLLAPACMCLVAGLHAVRVSGSGQTPWKGGGFGMFSTVDAETVRFIKAFLIADDGQELAIPLPDDYDHRVAELRAAPNEAQAQELAQLLAQRRWRNGDAHWQRVREAATDVAQRGIVTSHVLHPGNLRLSSEANLSGRSWEPLPASATDGVAFPAVRVEVWRNGFDRTSSQVRAQRILTCSAQRSQEQ